MTETLRTATRVAAFCALSLSIGACNKAQPPAGSPPGETSSSDIATESYALSGPTNLSASTSFNGSAIAQGASIWFNSSIVATGVPTKSVSHLYFTNQTITFSANATTYHLPVPDGTLVFDPNVATPSTQFVPGTESWLTQVPANTSASAFISGLSWLVPAPGLPANLQNVTWNGTASTDVPGISVTWSWGAAIYSPGVNGTCTPKTCAQVGANCGSVSDGCGGTLSCGTCTAPQTCGGNNVPNVCGAPVASCTGLCTRQVQCSPGVTSISGIVYAPTDPASSYGPQVDPVPHAYVYVPNGPVAAFTSGPSCGGQCGAPLTGNPLVITQAAYDGSFVLDNVPAGANVPLVIQSGKWRRQITIPYVTPCQDNPQPASLTRLPRTHLEGDIPLMAMVTGNVDTLECVLLKMGIASSEFTIPSGGGRVHIYVANGETLKSAPSESALWGAGGTINNYDYVLFACQGGEYDEEPPRPRSGRRTSRRRARSTAAATARTRSQARST